MLCARCGHENADGSVGDRDPISDSSGHALLAAAAKRRLREAHRFFTQVGNLWYMSVADQYLCEAVYAQDRPREFLRLADAFAASSLMTDRHNLVKRQVVLARSHLLRGSAVEADASARSALKLLESTDLIPDTVDALLVFADALDARGMGG